MTVNPTVSPTLIPLPPPYDMKADPRFREDGTFYLLRYQGRWYAGVAERQHYGWMFDTVYDAGLQMDYGITAIYEIEGKAERDTPLMEILADALEEEEALND